MCLCICKKKIPSAALKYARYPKVGKKKSMKSNIPIGFSLCHRPISASRRVDHVCGGEWMTRWPPSRVTAVTPADSSFTCRLHNRFSGKLMWVWTRCRFFRTQRLNLWKWRLNPLWFFKSGWKYIFLTSRQAKTRRQMNIYIQNIKSKRPRSSSKIIFCETR